jgi:hypothetical protein
MRATDSDTVMMFITRLLTRTAGEDNKKTEMSAPQLLSSFKVTNYYD